MPESVIPACFGHYIMDTDIDLWTKNIFNELPCLRVNILKGLTFIVVYVLALGKLMDEDGWSPSK